MDKIQVIAFLQALNQLEPFVPPLFARGIFGSPTAAVLVAIANGTAVCTVVAANASAAPQTSKGETNTD